MAEIGSGLLSGISKAGNSLYNALAPIGAAKTPEYNPTANVDLNAQNPYTDWDYNTFLRGMGFDEASAKAQVARKRADIQGQIESQRPAWQDKLTEGTEKIGDSAESRGMFRSGQRLLDQARFQRDVGRDQAAWEGGLRRQSADLAADLQVQLANLARQRAEQEVQARQALALQAIEDME